MFSEADLKLRHPCGLIISGPSSSGKTYTFYNILKNIDKVYTEKFRKLYIVYQQWQSTYDKIKKLPIEYEFISNISEVDSLNLRDSLLFLGDHITVFGTAKICYVAEHIVYTSDSSPASFSCGYITALVCEAVETYLVKCAWITLLS